MSVAPTAAVSEVGFRLGKSAASATFYSGLELPRPAGTAPLPLRSYQPELRRLQDQALAAFKPPRSIELHGEFINLNARLKLAGRQVKWLQKRAARDLLPTEILTRPKTLAVVGPFDDASTFQI